MIKLKNLKHRATKDIFWYSLGTFVPILVSLIRSPVFTRYFTAEEYGYYSLVFVAYSIFSIFLYSWLKNCIWRFYNHYKNTNKLNEFFSNLGLLYLLFTLVFIIITIVWSSSSNSTMVKHLTILICIHLCISSPINYIIIVYRLELHSRKYNIIQISRTLISFLIQFYLTYGRHFRIETIPISSIIIDLIILVIILPPFIKQRIIRLKNYSSLILKKIFSYALPGIVSSLTMLILISSDRYMIAYFGTIKEVGIYNQVYNLSNVSIMALINLFFAIINPYFIRELENNFSESNKTTQNYIVVFILLILPLTVCFSLFAPQVAQILLGKEFQPGYDLIPWIMFSSFIYGLALFSENRLKMQSHYRSIVISFIISAGLNIILNIIFLPIFSYKFAAISTLISYIFLFTYLLVLDIKRNEMKIPRLRILLPALSILLLQILFVLYMQIFHSLKSNILWMICEFIIFCMVYYTFVYFYYKSELQKVLNSIN